MKRRLIITALAAAISGVPAHAGAPNCVAHASGPYCDYSGKVYRAYINSSKQILLYFDTVLPENNASSAGITGVNHRFAAIYPLTEDPEFGRALYASLLQAQARDATITVQMRGTSAGYLKIDRIWVYDD